MSGKQNCKHIATCDYKMECQENRPVNLLQHVIIRWNVRKTDM